jgi:hypothetical protein
MADSDELSPVGLNGQGMGLLNGVGSTGNVQVQNAVCARTPLLFFLFYSKSIIVHVCCLLTQLIFECD